MGFLHSQAAISFYFHVSLIFFSQQRLGDSDAKEKDTTEDLRATRRMYRHDQDVPSRRVHQKRGGYVSQGWLITVRQFTGLGAGATTVSTPESRKSRRSVGNRLKRMLLSFVS
jgi:hypothetical protein